VSRGLLRVAGRSARASSVVAAIGIVFFVLLYVGIFTGSKGLLLFGPANDVCVLVQYVLALPVVFALHRILWRHAPGRSLVAVWVAVVGVLGVVVFQTLLLTGTLSFEQQILPASISVLLVGVWILVAGRVGRESGELPASIASIIGGALYFGYPLWVLRVGRQLLEAADSLET
jgi:hypothetical protein